jgi:hypothetical protein
MIAGGCPGLQGYGRLVALLAAASPLFLAVVRYAQLSGFTLLFWSLALVALRLDRRFAAGLALGCVAFKPQLGLVVGVVLIAARDWRTIAGALTTGIGQMVVAWMAAGSAVMIEYFGVLATEGPAFLASGPFLARGCLFLLPPFGFESCALFLSRPLRSREGVGFYPAPLGPFVGRERLGLDPAALGLEPARLFVLAFRCAPLRLAPFGLPRARFGHSDFRLQPSSFFRARLVGGGVGHCLQTRALFLAGVLDGFGGCGGELCAIFFACARRGRCSLRLETAALFVAHLRGGPVGDFLESGPLFLACVRRGERGIRRQPCAFFLARPLRGGGGFGLQAASVLEPFALGGLGFSLLAPERFVQGALGGGFRFDPQPFGLEPVLFRLPAQALGPLALGGRFGLERLEANPFHPGVMTIGTLILCASRGLFGDLLSALRDRRGCRAVTRFPGKGIGPGRRVRRNGHVLRRGLDSRLGNGRSGLALLARGSKILLELLRPARVPRSPRP